MSGRALRGRVNVRTAAVVAAAIAAGIFFFGRSETWRVRNAPPKPGPIVCFGDSLTRGFGAKDDESYPSRLAALLGREVLNRGVDGDTAETALERLERDVLAASPGVVVISLGGNDILRRVPIEVTLRSTREIFERTLAVGAMVVFLPVDPPFVSGERMAAVRELCRELGVVYADSVTADLWKGRTLMSDQIHPNAEGYRRIAENVRDVLARHR